MIFSLNAAILWFLMLGCNQIASRKNPDFELPSPQGGRATGLNPSSEDAQTCKDDMFYMDTTNVKIFDKSINECPPGYRLAHLDSPALFNHAAVFVFGCLGPAKEAWISTAMGTIYGEGDPVKLVSPDAIEKGGFRRHERRHGIQEKALRVPNFPVKSVNVKSIGSVQMDQSDIALPFLCQTLEVAQEE